MLTTPHHHRQRSDNPTRAGAASHRPSGCRCDEREPDAPRTGTTGRNVPFSRGSHRALGRKRRAWTTATSLERLPALGRAAGASHTSVWHQGLGSVGLRRSMLFQIIPSVTEVCRQSSSKLTCSNGPKPSREEADFPIGRVPLDLGLKRGVRDSASAQWCTCGPGAIGERAFA